MGTLILTSPLENLAEPEAAPEAEPELVKDPQLGLGVLVLRRRRKKKHAGQGASDLVFLGLGPPRWCCSVGFPVKQPAKSR